MQSRQKRSSILSQICQEVVTMPFFSNRCRYRLRCTWRSVIFAQLKIATDGKARNQYVTVRHVCLIAHRLTRTHARTHARTHLTRLDSMFVPVQKVDLLDDFRNVLSRAWDMNEQPMTANFLITINALLDKTKKCYVCCFECISLIFL